MTAVEVEVLQAIEKDQNRYNKAVARKIQDEMRRNFIADHTYETRATRRSRGTVNYAEVSIYSR